MVKLIKIEENPQIKCNKTVKDYLDADYIYIPYSNDYKLNIKNKNVLKNGIILSKDKKYIYSTVSGTILGIYETIVNNKKSNTIVIENDFKEKTSRTTGVKRNINKYSKEDVKNLVNGFNVYNDSLEGNTLIVSGIDNEPYEETMSYLISKYTEEILECIDALYNILDIHKCFFAIKNNDSDNVNTLINQIGTYPNIDLKLMPDLYPIGNKDILIQELVLPSKIENGVIFLTVEDVYAIYNVLKKNKPITEKLVTFSGDLLTKSKVMNVKIGTNIKDIITNEFKLKSNDYHIVINGLLSGYEINSLDAIITPEIRSVFINSASKERETKCINCGLCINNCPFGCNPRDKLRMEKCKKCGICNYICPSKIKLIGDKHE